MVKDNEIPGYLFEATIDRLGVNPLSVRCVTRAGRIKEPVPTSVRETNRLYAHQDPRKTHFFNASCNVDGAEVVISPFEVRVEYSEASKKPHVVERLEAVEGLEGFLTINGTPYSRILIQNT